MKKSCVISCPIDTYSGYGARSRDLFQLLDIATMDEWDIKVLPQKWGSTSTGYLADNNIIVTEGTMIEKLEEHPDIWMQVTIPNEFQRVGKKFNVGITAGIETDLCTEEWIEGINRMDEVWVSSKHAKDVFKNHPTKKVTTPIKVLPEGYESAHFYADPMLHQMDGKELSEELDQIKEDFCFLFVGHWIGRKNVEGLLSAFYQVFKLSEVKPALILKTQKKNASNSDMTEIEKAIASARSKFPDWELPNVYVLHGNMLQKDMNHLYNHPKVKAMVSATRGEGYGRPLLEFSAVGKPIIATRWSGHLDFLNSKYTHLALGELKPVPQSECNQWIIPGSKWFEVSHENLVTKLSEVYERYDQNLSKAKRQQQYVEKKFTLEKVLETVKEYCKEIDKKTPQQVQVKLPQL